MLLKSDADFMSSDFYSLQNNASATLGANLLNSDVFFLMPGQLSKTLSGQSSPEARYIGVMAEYQALDGKKMARLTSFACSRRKRDLPVLEMVRR
ncbi:type VI secretion system protein VasD [Enterobacter cloacae subsp. cloacae GS1]|nr:type VI secretion system protein VasD [Enterobacter cloacae subsp. cloacae GS1]